jgi:putative transposase
MKDYRCKLIPGRFYHVYNRGIDGCTLFHDKGNFRFFMRRYELYMSESIDTYAWCLMPNHFHLLIRVKEGDENVSHLKNAKHFADPSAAFQRLFTSYSKAFNKQRRRHGSLFEKPFRRIEVNNELYLKQLLVYIHTNPVHHALVNAPEQWEFSSYKRSINDAGIASYGNMIRSWFENEENFRMIHKQKVQLDNEFLLENE